MANQFANPQIHEYTVIKHFQFILVALFLSSGCAIAQEYSTKSKPAIRYFEDALGSYKYRYIEKSLGEISSALEKDSTFIEPYLLRAQIYQDIGKPIEAVADLRTVIAIDPKYDTRVYFNLAAAEADLLALTEALTHVDEFLNLDISDLSRKRGENLKEVIEVRKSLVDNPVEFNPENLGPGVNTKHTEHSPGLTADEQILYFTRKYPSKRKGPGSTGEDEDLYMSYMNPDGNWGTAIDLGNDINTSYREGAGCVSPDGKYLFFTSCNKPNAEGSCDLYIAFKQGDKWVKPRNLGSTVNSRFWETQPSFSSDGRTLFFVSNRAGKGSRDIWMTTIDNNSQWTKPINLSINTAGSEQSPFIHPDGKTLYFATDGIPGIGKHDLYKTTLLDDQGNCSEPINLGYPINSTDEDVSLMVSANGKTAYYASGMEGGYGGWDLYKFELPENVRPGIVTFSKGLVYNRDTKEPLAAKFELIDLETGKTVVESFSDQVNGEFLVSIPLNHDYALNVSAKGYLFFSENFSLSAVADTSAYAFDVPMVPIKAGERVVLKNIFFETNKYNLKAASKVELNKLITFLTENPKVFIEIGGHTDNVGSNAYNLELSENRAKSVYTYLIDNGIEASRLSFKGYSFSIPIATNETPEGRALNRRTEFKIISND